MSMTVRARWMVTVTAAEAAGFVVPAAAGALTAGSPAWVTVPAVLAAGAVEGLLLGLGQAAVLRRLLPGLPVRRWVAVTGGAAVFAYVLGMTPSTLADVWSGWPPGLLVPAVALLGVVLLNTIGVAQWTVLRRLVRHAGWWIVATAVAWLAALAVFVAVSTPLWHPGQAIAATIAVGAGAGLLMALTMAAVTGVAVRYLVPAAAPVPPVSRPSATPAG